MLYEFYREANALVLESLSLRNSSPGTQPYCDSYFTHYHESEMIELQDLSVPLSTPSLNTFASATNTTNEFRFNQDTVTHRNRNRNRNRIGNNTSPSLFAAVGDWVTTSAATVISAAHDLAEAIDIDEALENFTIGAERVAEASIVAGRAATSQAQSTIDGAIASYLKHSRRSRGTTYVVTGSCRGRGCHGTCCSSAVLMTEEDIARALELLQEQEAGDAPYQMRPPPSRSSRPSLSSKQGNLGDRVPKWKD